LIVDVFRLGNEIALPELFAQCMSSLSDRLRIVAVRYPEEIRNPRATDAEWLTVSDAVLDLNSAALFDHLNESVNCYAIHTKPAGADWHMRYIGHTDCRRAKTTIIRHLLPVGNRSSVIFARCRQAVSAGAQIGLSLIRVEPDSLRDFIQEKAVGEPSLHNLLDWNRKSPR
jgi:hypothetical protein